MNQNYSTSHFDLCKIQDIQKLYDMHDNLQKDNLHSIWFWGLFESVKLNKKVSKWSLNFIPTNILFCGEICSCIFFHIYKIDMLNIAVG